MYRHSHAKTDWFVVVDDDTFIFTDTLLRTLDYYHDMMRDEYLYIGNYNENGKGNKLYMAFGGGGVVLNRKLVR